MTRLTVLALALATLAACAAIKKTWRSIFDPVHVENGAATRDYAGSFDRGCAALESAVRGAGVSVSSTSREGDVHRVSGRAADAAAVEATATRVESICRIAVKVGDGATPEHAALAADIHERVLKDFDVVRRHYAVEFSKLWDAAQKSDEIEITQRVQPHSKIGLIAANRRDRAKTGVTMTVEYVEAMMTRITIEVGDKASSKYRRWADDIAETITKLLGVTPEEEK